MPDETPNRCRLVLVAPPGAAIDALPVQVAGAIAGGDVASLILPQYDLDEGSFQRLTATVAPAAQQAGVAVILAGDSRVVGRMGADGIHIEGGASELSEAVSWWAG